MTTENTKSVESKKNSIFVESNIPYENKVKLLHNLRARIINNDPALQGLLTFVPSKVVPDGHAMFDSVAYTNGDEMFFADKFFALEKPFQCAAIIHEMFHIVFRHVTRGQKRIHSLFNIACFKQGEKILTHNGYKEIQNLKIKDEVLVGGKVTAVMQNYYEGNMYTLHNMGCLNVEATEDHPFYIAKKIRVGSKYEFKYSWETAKDLFNFKNKYVCIPKLKTSKIPNIVLNNNYDNHAGRSTEDLKKSLDISKDFLYTLGYYVAKGSLASNKIGGIVFSLEPSDLYKKDRIMRYFESLRLNPSFKKVKNLENSYRLQVSSPIISRAFSEWFGIKSADKKIPQWILDLPTDLSASFIKGYFDGDGYRHKNNLRAWTKSELLARQLQILFAKHNRFLNIKYVERNNAGRFIRNHKIIDNQTGYLLHYIKCKSSVKTLNNNVIKSASQRWVNTKDYILTPIKNVSVSEHTGNVYNIETSTHTYIAGGILTHNCDAIINESIGFEDDLKIGGQNYAYFPKEHVINLDSIYTEFKIPLSDQKALHLWTSESLYDFLIKKLKDDLEKEEQEQMNSSNSQESKEQSDSNSSGNSKGKGKGKGKGKKEGSESDSSSQDKNAQSFSQAGKAQQSKTSNSASDLEKIEKQIEEIQRRLAKKHSMFNGSDIIPEGTKEAGVSEIDDFKWTQRFNRAKSQSNNSKNSVLGKINPDVYKPKIPWYIELRKYLVKRCMPFTETTWVRPARRMSSIKSSRTYMPGIQNKKGLDRMVVIVDTSGSCFNEEELSMFCTEVQAIQSQTGVEIALIFADTDVQSEFIIKNDGISLLDKIKSGIVKASGGGGTDMVKPFLYSLKKYRPVLTVICTDGYTPYPTKQEARKTNLLWVVNTNVEVPKECGKTLYIRPQ